MDISQYLQQQIDKIKEEYDKLNERYADAEEQLMIMRVELEHLRGAYQKLKEMEKELE